MTEQKAKYFDGLDLLRFFSAFALLLYHVTIHYEMPVLKMFVHNLVLGVEMFFIISGFLITYFLIEEKKGNGISIKNFYIKRVLRIFPLYFFIIFIAYTFYYIPTVDFKKYIFFIGNYWLIEINNWPPIAALVPLWSLCMEEQFYFVIPFFLWIIPLKKIPYFLISLIILSACYRVWLFHTYDNYWMRIYCDTLSRADTLLIGALVAYYHSVHGFTIRMNSYVLGLIVFQTLALMTIVDSADFTGDLNAIFRKYIFIIPILLIFFGVVLNSDENHKVLNWFKYNRVFNYLGKISFGIYMYQLVVGGYLDNIPAIKQSVLIYGAIMIPMTILIAALSYELVEKRIINLKKYLIKKEEPSN